MVEMQTQFMLAAAPAWMVYVLPAVGAMLLFLGIYQAATDSRTSSRKKIQDRLRGQSSNREKTPESLIRRGAARGAKTLADAIVGQFKFVPKLQRLLDQADVDWSAAQTLVNLASSAIFLTCVLMVLHFNPVVSVSCGGGVLVLPLLWLHMRRRSRMTKLINQLPDVFEMMSQALRAGHSLAGSIQTVYEQMPPPIATEFAQVYHEQNLGVKIEDALLSMATRVDSLDVRFFVTAVMIQRQTGGDLAEVLDNISTVIRGRIELQGLVRGLTAEGRLSGWVLFALPFVVFFGAMLMNPDYANTLLDDPRGRIMLMIAGGMQLMGIAMIRWIVNIKV
ncbi:MAG: type II secretion system F family protein [Planctomycetota bacterium]